MKDARGHGSDGKGGGGRGPLGFRGGSSVYRSQPFEIAHGAQFGPSRMKSDRDFKSDADRTVHDLRSRMSNTGPGHQTGLMQGIKNLLGRR